MIEYRGSDIDNVRGRFNLSHGGGLTVHDQKDCPVFRDVLAMTLARSPVIGTDHNKPIFLAIRQTVLQGLEYYADELIHVFDRAKILRLFGIKAVFVSCPINIIEVDE